MTRFGPRDDCCGLWSWGGAPLADAATHAARKAALDGGAGTGRATVFADASYSQATGAAGWAAWMVADGMGNRTASGAVRERVRSSNEAEVVAIAEALREAVEAGFAPRGARVMLQSDSAYALAVVREAVPGTPEIRHGTAGAAVGRTNPAKWSPLVRARAAAIAALALRAGLSLAVRHVPGHRRGDGRQWVNRECDRLAGLAARSARGG